MWSNYLDYLEIAPFTLISFIPASIYLNFIFCILFGYEKLFFFSPKESLKHF